jgi:hypothetical protein
MRKRHILVKFLIGDRGFKRTGILDVEDHETPKPEIKIRERVWSCAEGRVGEKDLWIRFSQRFHWESKELLQLMNE